MKTKKEKTKSPPFLENRKARFKYEILETIEAGIVLQGSEVKSLRKGKGNITESYAVNTRNELFLLNLHIQSYENSSHFNHEETRSRKLLLHKKEILKLKNGMEAKGYTLIPLKMYFNEKGRVKVLLGLGRGKKVADKREDEKKRDANIEIQRALKEKF